MKAKRKVRIVSGRGGRVWFVDYVERTKHQRYSAAQFDARHTSLEEVREWVKRNPHLELVED